MPLIDRSDLKYDYSWKTEPAGKPRSSATVKGETKSQIFRREEGDQVLSFINDYSRNEGINNKEEALEIERLLRHKMKSKDMTHDEVRLWLKDQLKKERV